MVKHHFDSRTLLPAIIPIVMAVGNYFDTHRESEQHSGRADGIAALAVSANETASADHAEIVALKSRLARVERRSSHRTVVIHDTLTVRQMPQQSKGLLYRILHIGG